VGRSQRVKEVLFGEKLPHQGTVFEWCIDSGIEQQFWIIGQYDQKNNLSERASLNQTIEVPYEKYYDKAVQHIGGLRAHVSIFA